jgi:N-methylhydantoinase B
VPVEMIESDYPIRIERYGFVADTGGPGRYRGGLSLARDYRILADDIYFGVRSDKSTHPPHGLAGGGEGAAAVNRITSAGAADAALPPMPTRPINLRKGDLYRHVMAGGGGFGNPLERDVEKVRADVIDGKVTTEHARAAYGVVISNDAEKRIDESATRALRTARRAAN